MTKSKKQLKIITVGGMIGVGKTTFIENAVKNDKKNHIKSKSIYELFEPSKLETSLFVEKHARDDIMELFLKLYYDNVNRINSDDEFERIQGYTVTLGHQINFLINRATKILDAINFSKKQDLDVIYIDRSIFEDLIFTKNNLTDNYGFFDDYMISWTRWFRLINQLISDNNIILENFILVADEATILQRIAKRGREIEQGEELTDYFKSLNKRYEKDLSCLMTKYGWEYKIVNNN